MPLLSLIAVASAQDAAPDPATGVDVDVELVRYTLAPGSVPGVDSADPTLSGAVRVGLTSMYVHDPVVLYTNGERVGAPVHSRLSTQVGVELGVAKWASLRLSLPFYAQWGGQTEQWSADGAALGDMSVGGRFAILQRGPLQAGAHLDLALPTSGESAWAGERGVRAMPGVLLGLDAGPFGLNFDAAALVRAPVVTSADLALGTEGTAALAALLHLGDKLTPWIGATARVPLTSSAAGSGSVEALLGAQYRVVDAVQVELLGGKGLTDGYGSSGFRVGANLTWMRSPKVEEAPVVVVEDKPPPRAEELLEDLPEPEEPDILTGTGEVTVEPQARIVAEQIVIRDPIQFKKGTDEILPESDPVLKAIEKLMGEHPEILSLVVEGHASDEGSYEYNYDLSVRRALAIYKALVLAGVHPDRLAVRGVGEVAPSAAGAEETALAANRRVIFRIARQWVQGDPFPGWGADIVLPWSGQPARVTASPEGFGAPPPPPPPPPEAIPETPGEGLFKEDE